MNTHKKLRSRWGAKAGDRRAKHATTKASRSEARKVEKTSG